MDRVNAFASCEDAQRRQFMWTEMFLDEAVVLALSTAEDKKVVVEFMKKAVGLQPAWTPTKCAVQIEQLTETAMASETALSYSEAYIYSLALLLELDPGPVRLTDKQTEVAFKLAKHWKALGKRSTAAGGPQGAAAGDSGTGAEQGERATGPARDKEEGSDEEVAPMDWEALGDPATSGGRLSTGFTTFSTGSTTTRT